MATINIAFISYMSFRMEYLLPFSRKSYKRSHFIRPLRFAGHIVFPCGLLLNFQSNTVPLFILNLDLHFVNMVIFYWISGQTSAESDLYILYILQHTCPAMVMPIVCRSLPAGNLHENIQSSGPGVPQPSTELSLFFL